MQSPVDFPSPFICSPQWVSLPPSYAVPSGFPFPLRMQSPRLLCASSGSVSTSGAARYLQSEVQHESGSAQPRALAKAEARRKTHRRLRIISGTAGGELLQSRRTDAVHPQRAPRGVDSYCLRLGRSQPASLHRRWLKERARRLPAATLYHTGGWAQHPATDGALSNHRRFITHFIMCSLRYVVAAGKRLLSPQGDVTRPMMEMVRSPSVPTPCVVLP